LLGVDDLEAIIYPQVPSLIQQSNFGGSDRVPATGTMRQVRGQSFARDLEDYSVVVDGKKVGRIYRTLAPGGKDRWRWSIYDRNPGGLVDSLDDAKAAFKVAWGDDGSTGQYT
jgi:hypothetical protein